MYPPTPEMNTRGVGERVFSKINLQAGWATYGLISRFLNLLSTATANTNIICTYSRPKIYIYIYICKYIYIY